MTILEIVDILTIGLSSFNVRKQVPNDIREDKQFIPPKNIKSQTYLDQINLWTMNQKMLINQTKTKTMIFNYTNKYQFSTRLNLNNQILETVKETKHLGTIITDYLKWDQNTNYITKKAYARLELLRKLKKFLPPSTDLRKINIIYIRSLLEQSSNVWNSSLTIQNEKYLERIQKVALKIILDNNYNKYENALYVLDSDTLKDRREQHALVFARKCL